LVAIDEQGRRPLQLRLIYAVVLFKNTEEIMGFFSSLKNKLKKAFKWAVRVVKAAVRLGMRLVVTAIGIGLGVFDLFLGFIGWPRKKLRLHIFILADPNGPIVDPADPDLTTAVDFARNTLKARFNVEMVPYSRNLIEVIKEPAPSAALTVDCGLIAALREDFTEAGEFFAKHLAGWNGIPISTIFPITVFIVSNVVDKQGCSLGPLTDYIIVDPDGVANPTLMIHEIGHACNLWHSWTKSNLMFADFDRGDGVKWFQKNLLRSSRHITYW
jgi:hypothetical protein